MRRAVPMRGPITSARPAGVSDGRDAIAADAIAVDALPGAGVLRAARAPGTVVRTRSTTIDATDARRRARTCASEHARVASRARGARTVVASRRAPRDDALSLGRRGFS
jgi:hypothetical protein